MVNKVILIGRVGKTPETRTVGETTIANFTLATTRKVKGDNVTQWHNVTAFGKTAEVINNYAPKGSMLYIEGEIQYSSYEKEGRTVHTTNIVCNNVSLLTPKSDKPKDDLPNDDLPEFMR